MSINIKKLEIHLLALRDAADAALGELELIKAEAPQSAQKLTDGVERHLKMLNTKKWGKRKPGLIK